MNAKTAVLNVTAVLIITGCKSMVTTVNQPGVSNSVRVVESGVSYYLPKVAVKVVGVWDSTTGFWDLTATPIYGPDVDAGKYEAQLNKNCLFDNSLTIAADQNGLLQTLNGTSTDQTGNIVGSLAAAAATAYSFGATSVATAAAGGSLRTFNINTNSDSILGTRGYSNISRLVNAELSKTNSISEAERDLLQAAIGRLRATNSLSGIDYKLLNDALAATSWFDWSLASTNARFSSFQTYLAPIVTNGSFRSDADAPSVSIAKTNHTVYVLSPMSSGQVVYASFDLSLTAQADVGHSGFPQPFGSAKNRKWYHGVLVRDPVPYTLGITGHLWSTYWLSNSTATNVPGYFMNMSGQGNQGGAGATQQQGGQSSSLSYLWTYNLQTNLLYMTNAYVSDQVSYDALEQTLMLPDASHTRLLPISRRPMVTDTTSLALVNGMLQSRQDVRPSEAFGWLGLPKTIITAIVPFFGSASGGGSGQGSGGGNQSSGTGGQGGQGTQNGQGGQAAQGGQAGGNQSNISTQPVSPPIQ